MEILVGILLVVALLLFIGFGLPWLFRLKKGYLLKGLEKHEEKTGQEVELLNAGMPPLRLWLLNRKGDCWGRVRFADGTEKWARYGTRLTGPALAFYD